MKRKEGLSPNTVIISIFLILTGLTVLSFKYLEGSTLFLVLVIYVLGIITLHINFKNTDNEI